MKGIPDNITFHCQAFPENCVNDITGEDYGFVLAAFPKDAKTDHSTAIRWAKCSYPKSRHDDRLNQSVKNGITFTIPNDDIVDIAITDISYRGQGSKVYKALIYDKYLIDISAECLFEVLSCGNIENGRIKSPMFFGIAKNKMSLILRDGKFHKDILYKNLPDIKEKDLVKFGVYEKLNSKVIYLGKTNFVRLSTNYDTRRVALNPLKPWNTVYERFGHSVTKTVGDSLHSSISIAHGSKFVSNIAKNSLGCYVSDSKTFKYKLKTSTTSMDMFQSVFYDLETFDFTKFDIKDSVYIIQYIYNLVISLGYTPKSDSLTRLIAWVDSLQPHVPSKDFTI